MAKRLMAQVCPDRLRPRRRTRKPTTTVFAPAQVAPRRSSGARRTRRRRRAPAACAGSGPAAKGRRPVRQRRRAELRAGSRGTASTTAFVLLGLERAGGVDEPPARAHERRQRVEQLALPLGVAAQVARRAPPADVGMPAERPQAAAGRVEEHGVEARRGRAAGGASAPTGRTFVAPQRRTSAARVRSRRGEASAATTGPRGPRESASSSRLAARRRAGVEDAAAGRAARWATSCEPWSCR